MPTAHTPSPQTQKRKINNYSFARHGTFVNGKLRASFHTINCSDLNLWLLLVAPTQRSHITQLDHLFSYFLLHVQKFPQYQGHSFPHCNHCSRVEEFTTNKRQVVLISWILPCFSIWSVHRAHYILLQQIHYALFKTMAAYKIVYYRICITTYIQQNISKQKKTTEASRDSLLQ